MTTTGAYFTIDINTYLGGITPDLCILTDYIGSIISKATAVGFIADGLFHISFYNDLTTADHTTILASLANYGTYRDQRIAELNLPFTPNSFIQSPKNTIINNTSYTVLDHFVFKGGTAIKVMANSYMDPAAVSYSVRIFDRTNNLVLLESTKTNQSNNSSAIVTLGFCSNVPAGMALIEIQAMVTRPGNNKTAQAYINTVSFQYA